jgi:bifunctional UDP-N-acetylglucosamine pyrophosphorylase/glucosamine-1-phosphate N-acetyltransferase
MTSFLTVTIMAAGEGKRMRSSIPKVLHLFNGIPMLVRILLEVKELNPQKIIVITGKYDALIKKTISENINQDFNLLNKIVYVQQTNPMGTGHAISCTLDYYEDSDNVLILNGDMPCIKSGTLNQFIQNGINSLFVAKLDNPFGYGRIIVNSNNYIKYIREEKDCNEEERNCKLVNVGIYYFSAVNLKKNIPLIDCNNIQNEYYLTDIVKIMNNDNLENKEENNGISIYKIDENNNYQIQGVNTPEELRNLEELENLKKN